MSTITVQSPLTVAAPRAANLAAALFSRFLRWLDHSQRVRADTRSRVSRASEAAAVRAYAQRFMNHDPRYAADLFAAADRHESE